MGAGHQDTGGSWSPVDGGELVGGGAAGDYSGNAVAIHGGTAVFGAWGDDGMSFDTGSVSFYLYGGRWNSYSHTLPSNPVLQMNDNFGTAVAVSGDFAVVGSDGDGIPSTGPTPFGHHSGAAYFYKKNGSTWEIVGGKIKPADNMSDDVFGKAIAIDGTTAAIAAFNDDDQGRASGSVYIYNYIGNQWDQSHKVSASDGHADQEFGVSVAIEGSTLVVGARHDSIGFQTNEGAAYVYTFNGINWTDIPTQKLVASNGRRVDDKFGISVGISGDTIVVGSWGNNKAYIFERDGGNQWIPGATLAHPNPPPVSASNGPRFGWSVDISNNVIAVGAPASASPDPQLSKGAAYLYRKNGAVWNLVPEETRTGNVAGDEFGYAVALSDSQRFVVGAGLDDADSATVYRYDGQSWVFEHTFYSSVTTNYDAWFGEAVAISDDSILIGAYSHGTGPVTNTGAAYFYQYDDCLTGQFVTQEHCAADINGDGQLDYLDISGFLLLYSNGELSVDFDGTGDVDFLDMREFLRLYLLGCP